MSNDILDEIRKDEDLKILDQVEEETPAPEETIEAEEEATEETTEEATEETTEETTEEDTDETSEEDETEETTEEKPQKTNHEILSELLGEDISEDKYGDTINKFKDMPKAEKAIAEANNKIKQLEIEKQELIDMFDPATIFGSEEEAKYYALKKAHPEYDPTILSKVLGNNISDLGTVDVIIMEAMLKDGDIYQSKADVIESLEDEYDIDLSDGLDAIDNGVIKRKFLKRAKDAKSTFKALQEEKGKGKELNLLKQKETQREDMAEFARKRKEQWEPFVEGLSNKLSDVEIKGEGYTFKYELGKDYREKVNKSKEAILKFYVSKGIELTDSVKESVMREIEAEYFTANRQAILDAYAEDYHSRKIEKEADKAVNPKRKKTEAVAKKTGYAKSKSKAEDYILSH